MASSISSKSGVTTEITWLAIWYLQYGNKIYMVIIYKGKWLGGSGVKRGGGWKIYESPNNRRLCIIVEDTLCDCGGNKPYWALCVTDLQMPHSHCCFCLMSDAHLCPACSLYPSPGNSPTPTRHVLWRRVWGKILLFLFLGWKNDVVVCLGGGEEMTSVPS